MTTVAIQPILDAMGQRSYRAVAGDKQSIGKTAAMALDALTIQLAVKQNLAEYLCFKVVVLSVEFLPLQWLVK